MIQKGYSPCSQLLEEAPGVFNPELSWAHYRVLMRVTPADLVQDPYVLEFTGLSESSRWQDKPLIEIVIVSLRTSEHCGAGNEEADAGNGNRHEGEPDGTEIVAKKRQNRCQPPDQKDRADDGKCDSNSSPAARVRPDSETPELFLFSKSELKLEHFAFGLIQMKSTQNGGNATKRAILQRRFCSLKPNGAF